MGKKQQLWPPSISTTPQLEYALWQTHGVRVVQRTLAQLKQQATMEQDGTLRLDGSEALGSWDGLLGLGNPINWGSSQPIGSMYGIYIITNIGGILMVNVTIYSIHGSYGQ